MSIVRADGGGWLSFGYGNPAFWLFRVVFPYYEKLESRIHRIREDILFKTLSRGGRPAVWLRQKPFCVLKS